MDNNQLFTGVLGDPREDPRVINGWSTEEVLPSSLAVDWKKKSISELKKYPVWDQAGTNACVAFSKAKQISIRIFNMTGVWIDFSPASIYQLRANKPTGGMNIADANAIVNTHGCTLEALMKSQNLTEEQIDNVKRTKIADLFAGAIAEAVVRYLYVPIDIEKIAEAIEAGKAVSLLLYGTGEEYSRYVPVILHPSMEYHEAPIHHEVVAVDYFLDADGVKKIYINDSAHFGGLAVRELTSEFIEERVISADILDVFTFDPGVDNPTIQKPRYDGSIISVQKCLRYEGFFPSNIDFVESLGPITKQAISKFQVKYGLHPTGTGTLGPLTVAKLKALYP